MWTGRSRDPHSRMCATRSPRGAEQCQRERERERESEREWLLAAGEEEEEEARAYRPCARAGVGVRLSGARRAGARGK
jgi:hypothetical protein